MEDKDWDDLVARIKRGACTPFLGAGASDPYLPLANKIAEVWLKELHDANQAPTNGAKTLNEIAQFVAVTRDLYAPREWVANYLNQRLAEKENEPNYNNPDEPYSILASLGAPIYLTSNYDKFMSLALTKVKKDVVVDYAKWNQADELVPGRLDRDVTYTPSAAQPLVYHFHGVLDKPDTIVISEDDYIDYIVAFQKKLLPPCVQGALNSNSLLFIGYGLKDINFRVMMRVIESYNSARGRTSVTVQISGEDAGFESYTNDYLNKYLRTRSWKVYWGTASTFLLELKKRLS